ncbi:putative pla2g4b [Chlamydoabsidia padenii]|nr:putative pla2g4b [Chlamydoabsidia padenii]
MTKKEIEKSFLKYIKEYQDLNGVKPQVFEQPPSPLEFFQKCVHPNRPALIKGAIDHWPANELWTDDYLRMKMKDQQVTVAVTPNGRADAVILDQKTNQEYFVMPHEEQMTFDAFLNHLSPSNYSEPVAYYISLQNGSLPLEYGQLEQDIDPEIDWCSKALGCSPDAVNFWFGDDKSVTSLHKDPYENCYAVVRGQKTFVLFPPTEYMCLHESNYQSAIYTPTDDAAIHFEITPLKGKVPWIPVDPLFPDLEKYPRFKYAKPMIITVNQGEMLYLPSLWFHHVLQQGQPQQGNGVIAINYWYDMNYNHALFVSMGLSRRLICQVVDGQDSLEMDSSNDDDDDDDDE